MDAIRLLLFGVTVLLVQETAGVTITGLRLQKSNNVNNEGLLLVMTSGEWYPVCRSSEVKIWGVKETLATCRQLGYTGGWSIDVGNNYMDEKQCLVNFDCTSSYSNLEDCGGSLETLVPDIQFVGIHCYDTFMVQLVGGVAPNAGRVEVKYDDAWYTVCNGDPDNDDEEWSFDNAELVCKDLGFPGTMFANHGGQSQGQRRIIYDYRCPVTEATSLSGCVPDQPITSNGKSSCRYKGGDAGVICADTHPESASSKENLRYTLIGAVLGTCFLIVLLGISIVRVRVNTSSPVSHKTRNLTKPGPITRHDIIVVNNESATEDQNNDSYMVVEEADLEDNTYVVKELKRVDHPSPVSLQPGSVSKQKTSNIKNESPVAEDQYDYMYMEIEDPVTYSSKIYIS